MDSPQREDNRMQLAGVGYIGLFLGALYLLGLCVGSL